LSFAPGRNHKPNIEVEVINQRLMLTNCRLA